MGDNAFTVVEYLPLPSNPSQKKRSSLKGALYFLVGVLSYAIANVFIKTSAEYYPLGEMVILRGIIFLIPLALYIISTQTKNLRGVFYTPHLKIHIIQGILSAFCLYFLFYAFDVMPLSDATAISFAETFIITLGAVLFLKERLTLKNWIILFIGFLGILIITQPDTSNLHIKGSLSCLLAVTFDAGVLLSLRKISKTDKALTILFYYALFSTLGGLIFIPFEPWVPLIKEHMFDILGLGIFGALGQIFITKAFQRTHAGVLAPLIYTELLWSLLFDEFIWKKLPNFSMIFGSTLVILCGLYILRQEYAQNRPPILH